MRLKAKVDKNQKQIVADLRKIGRSVMLLHREGKGVPDLLVGNGVGNILVEIKSEGETLNDNQLKFHDEWRGPIVTAWTSEQAIQLTSPHSS